MFLVIAPNCFSFENVPFFFIRLLLRYILVLIEDYNNKVKCFNVTKVPIFCHFYGLTVVPLLI